LRSEAPTRRIRPDADREEDEQGIARDMARTPGVERAHAQEKTFDASISRAFIPPWSPGFVTS
jgi:hypothetical protein